ncbi:hypothetical protein Syun_025828 [Stephania yunnanensis]|uniref:Uncharacterized protein n=1 Tax=Stephania yunnanensis TaxID=152371 RepID=A0AAP0EZI4_9MAGN
MNDSIARQREGGGSGGSAATTRRDATRFRRGTAASGWRRRRAGSGGAGERSAAAPARQRQRRGFSGDAVDGAVARRRSVGFAISTKSRRRDIVTRSRVSGAQIETRARHFEVRVFRAPRTSSEGKASWLGETFVYYSPLMIFTGFHN